MLSNILQDTLHRIFWPFAIKNSTKVTAFISNNEIESLGNHYAVFDHDWLSQWPCHKWVQCRCQSFANKPGLENIWYHQVKELNDSAPDVPHKAKLMTFFSGCSCYLRETSKALGTNANFIENQSNWTKLFSTWKGTKFEHGWLKSRQEICIKN